MTMNLSAQEVFLKLELEFPPAPKPLGIYKTFLVEGKYLYLSGHGPVQPDQSLTLLTAAVSYLRLYGAKRMELA
ncbi:hypothetical protein [Pedobacter sp. N36a]|uniref:hypothetical protein n=1 Tax=Pedobacter sp. N36a TaxID=2767996 RepID=UPI002102E834|nr:hypothetical protein [Pedobacter sp. N36a]